jgi:HAD superfamily hydrolase (TIGR01509 family)
MSHAIRTIIFDLSEVLISGLCGIEESLSVQVQNSPPEVLAALGGDLLVALCRGEISEDAFLTSVLSNTGWAISAEDLKLAIRSNFARKMDGMDKLLEQLAIEYELVLLSDHGKEWVQHIHEIHPHLQIFRTRLYSFDLGQTKREPSTFQRVLASINRAADECIFIDDNIANVECARSVGIQAFRFSNAETLVRDLQVSSILKTIGKESAN